MKQIITLILFLLFIYPVFAQNKAMEYLNTAIEYNQQNEYLSSLQYCNSALDQNPEMSNAWFLRGVNNFKLNNYKDAIVDFSVTLNFQPEYAEAWFYRGKAKQANGNLVEALADYNKARELNPGKSTVLVIKGIISSIFGGSGKNKKVKK